MRIARSGQNVRALALAALCAGLCQCREKPQPPPAATAPKPAPYALSLTYAFTDKAAARLRAHPQDFIVTARYYGLPLPATQAMADENGVIPLGTASAEGQLEDRPVTINAYSWPARMEIRFAGQGLPADKLSSIAGAKPLAQIVVKPLNGVGCDVFQDYVATAQSRQVTLICDVK